MPDCRKLPTGQAENEAEGGGTDAQGSFAGLLHPSVLHTVALYVKLAAKVATKASFEGKLANGLADEVDTPLYTRMYDPAKKLFENVAAAETKGCSHTGAKELCKNAVVK